jgi:hypothetical protein
MPATLPIASLLEHTKQLYLHPVAVAVPLPHLWQLMAGLKQTMELFFWYIWLFKVVNQ